MNAGRHFLPRTYHGDVDAFGVYCPQTGRCYLVPMSAIVQNSAVASLWVDPPRNGQAVGVHRASEFEVGAR